jgi:hypothetical protein
LFHPGEKRKAAAVLRLPEQAHIGTAAAKSKERKLSLARKSGPVYEKTH